MEPTKEQIERAKERVRSVLAEVTGFQEAEFKDDTHFFNDLNFDELHDVECIMGIEDEFDIPIPNSEHFNTVNDYIKYFKANHKEVFV
jgi:acyl carrier protein